MKSFEYFAPTSLEDAMGLLKRYGGKAKALAGGTDLLVQMKERTVTPSYLIDLKHIPGLSGIRHSKRQGLRIGALTTLNEILASESIEEKYPALIQGAEWIGCVQVRNQATIGGNLCNASPSADMAPGLIALDAKARIVGPEGARELPLEAFFRGPGRSALRNGEILTEVVISDPPPRSGASYIRHTPRVAMDIAVVGVGAYIALNGEKSCEDARIVLGAVAPTPIRVRRAERILKGKPLEEPLIERAAQRASEASKPIDDVRGSVAFRREIVAVLIRRTLKEAIEVALKL